MRKLAFILLFPLLGMAADSPASSAAVADMARKVPGEFAADALIRLASVDSLEKARRIDLLNQAFERAAEAQEPIKRQAAIVKVAGAASFLNRAFAQDLDATSLRLRAVEAMAKLDPERATALFQRIPPLRVPKLTCAEFMVYNVAPYYEALARLGSQAQVMKQFDAMANPVEIGPATKVVLAASGNGDFQARLTAFTAAVRKISGDDRSFTFAGDAGPQLLPLVEEAKRRKMSPLPLLEAYRLYLVTNEQTTRCSDDDLMGPVTESTFVMATGAPLIGGEGAGFFNEKLRISPLLPIQEQEVTPTRLDGVAEGLRGCEDTGCQAIGQQYNELIFNPETRTPYPPSQKSSPEWQSKVQKLLTAMAEWKPGSAVSPAQYYRYKSATYWNILSLVPAGALQEDVVKAMIDFTENSDFQKEHRIEWFLPANILIGRMAMDPLGPGKFAGRLRESKDPVIAMYSALEVVAPRSPDKIMSLM
jgi:hypothetical protein